MEFRDYWQIVWRRRYLIGPLLATTFLASLLFNLVLPPVYKTDTTVHVMAVVSPRVPGQIEYYNPEYYRTIVSEYITDDLSVIVKGETFARRVSDRIRNRYGQDVDVKEILDSITTTKKLHRTLKISIATGSERLTRWIAEGADEVLRADGASFFSATADGVQPVQINVIDPPRKPTAPSILRRLLDVLLHTAVAAVVGIGLAFTLHYLDDRIQDEDDAVRTLGWRVLGTVPLEAAPAGGASGGAPAWNALLARGWRKRPAA